MCSSGQEWGWRRSLGFDNRVRFGQSIRALFWCIHQESLDALKSRSDGRQPPGLREGATSVGVSYLDFGHEALALDQCAAPGRFDASDGLFGDCPGVCVSGVI
ncbi:MAG: hypothetical protein R2705_25205 [Ilumatobacteraceae bacterium]